MEQMAPRIPRIWT